MPYTELEAQSSVCDICLNIVDGAAVPQSV